MVISPKLMTADELLRRPSDGRRHELIAGVLTTMAPTGDEQGTIVGNVTGSLQPHVRRERLGRVTAGEPGFLLTVDPDTVRAPDIAFIRRGAGPMVSGYRPGAPDLAIEVISPSDLYTEVEAKVAMWFTYGARMVIVINPRQQTVTVYRSLTHIQRLTSGDVLDGEDVVPGWRVAVADLFADTAAE